MRDCDGWHLRMAAHYNGGSVFFAYLMRCIEQPRLSRYDRYDRKTKAVVSVWRVDGSDRASFDDAIAALSTPPVFTAAELDELSKVTDAWEDIRKVADFALNHALVDKGAVEWKDGKCRRRQA